MASTAVPKLFQPTRVGNSMLAHRVVLAPLTRLRADKAHVHTDLAVEYYAQRASVPGTLLISEGTVIAAKAGGYPHVPGIWSDEQVAAWRKITDVVHAQGSRIFCQLWAIGRGAFPGILEAEDPSLTAVSSSEIAIKGVTLLGQPYSKPRALTVPEIQEYVDLYATAAQNAIRAGFDGVEVHGANGYLIDQFLQDTCNTRTDVYGGSIENRCRFALEIVDVVVRAIGADRVGFRVSPWSPFQDMRMADPRPTFTYLVRRLAELHPDLAYLHAVEAHVAGSAFREPEAWESNDFMREIWAPRPFICAGGFERDSALAHSEETGDLIAFGRAYIANPDLPTRLAKNWPLNKGSRETYYIPMSAEGYTDYPFIDESAAAA
ncbi:hypothetical protein POSPLADRAFT_1143778 [Postia placenta MAD-698-R-SB12]|uniref:NADH:flavin oxidoreductase/NADH oxidase N-terminal domain-containing protein n=1 Tax=Postia placenta MAD-698-R-SB12 TaxID=670580 RepID=A0A1X6N163_9APHY|nr:hypothetical protein POSPLADRAFT_1143778 [Postia placenta MAD-698-R-SB12]OSX62206.1 hypothetical protein POSPLADRAFT_1143778 [Postia placenta MAD-698-R-SB12]